MAPQDLKRFELFAEQRGYDVPRYVGACEAWEEQQLLIDKLKRELRRRSGQLSREIRRVR